MAGVMGQSLKSPGLSKDLGAPYFPLEFVRLLGSRYASGLLDFKDSAG